jgi:hypothetical protein
LEITHQQIAIAREAINRLPDLSASARRVAHELLNHVNRETGLAWPSEARLATALGLSVRSIERAKAQLRDLGLLTWQRRGTNKRGRTNLYSLSWEKLLNIAARITAKVKAAAIAARNKLSATVSKARETAHRPFVDATKVAHYLHQCFNFKGGKVSGLAQAKPQRQVLTDQQLDAKAQARIYDALKALGHAAMAQFFNHPNAAQLEAEAVKAERYSPAQGRTGLAIIAGALA